MPEIVLVGRRECALAHGEVPDRVHQIGLPFPVVPGNAVDVRREADLPESYVPEILNYYPG